MNFLCVIGDSGWKIQNTSGTEFRLMGGFFNNPPTFSTKLNDSQNMIVTLHSEQTNEFSLQQTRIDTITTKTKLRQSDVVDLRIKRQLLLERIDNNKEDFSKDVKILTGCIRKHLNEIKILELESREDFEVTDELIIYENILQPNQIVHINGLPNQLKPFALLFYCQNLNPLQEPQIIKTIRRSNIYSILTDNELFI